jgi:pseudouridine-5'-phosphate glycosidase
MSEDEPMPDLLDVAHDISCALNRNDPVVALESSFIAQGLPSDVGVSTALAMQEAITAAGATPATIGVIEGIVRVGLSREEIERLAGGEAAKIAARDIPYAVARKLDGGTTVSATARIASVAGIPIMATGGIGGVHRGFADSHDISADLWEMARTPIIIVCSGVKSVLDISATAEWLESHSIPVYGYQTDELPAFYSRSSGVKVPKLENALDLAEILNVSAGAFGLRSAILIAVPAPESAEIDVSKEIAKATHQAVEQGIKGKEITPFLLKRVGELTGGKSIESNVALLKNNAKVAADIACALSETSNRRMGFTI